MSKSTPLAQKKCQPCEGIGSPINKDQAVKHLKEVENWQIDSSGKSIYREYTTKNFITAINFIQKAAQIAEAQNHHPNIHLTGYRKLRIDLSTHAIGGLSENDFIVAAKLNELPIDLK